MQNDNVCSFPLTAQLGRVLGGRFRIDALLGTGSMGAVFQAWDTQGEAPCAVKLLLPELTQQQLINIRFLDEARMASQLCHPNIVEVWNHYQAEDGTLYLVMELLQGQDLYTFLQSRGSLPLPHVLQLVKQIGSALHMVHLAGIVHRDIKPKNIFLVEGSGTTAHPTIKIIDFGLAKLLDQKLAPRRGSDGMLIGTPAYLPPEAWNGVSADVDARADQWALAALTYLMLSGRLPYDCEDDSQLPVRNASLAPPIPLRELVPGIPTHIDSAVARGLSRDKSQRFPGILDFLRALQDLPPAASTLHLSARSTSPRPWSTPSLLSAMDDQDAAADDADPPLATLVSEALLDHPLPPQHAPTTTPTQDISPNTLPPILLSKTEAESTQLTSLSWKIESARAAKVLPHAQRRWASPRRQYGGYLLPALSAAALLAWSTALIVLAHPSSTHLKSAVHGRTNPEL